MESAAVLRSYQYAVGTSSRLKSLLEKPRVVTIKNAAFSNLTNLQVFDGKIISSTNRRGSVFVSCVKDSETTGTAKSGSEPNGAVLPDSQQHGLQKSPVGAIFPNGLEALLTEVCDETKIAELKVKFGAFEMLMKRNIDSPTTSAPIVPQITAAPVPINPAKESTPTAPPAPPKSSSEKVSPFTNVSVEKASKLATLETSGFKGYVIVSSPTVGVFRRARTVKGQKKPIACKEGQVTKEGLVIAYVDQFGTELPIKSDVAGEVLKFLYNDGEAVGYGDPLAAVLPSFHDIK